MTFDTLIIGGGHSGLQQGIALQKSGQNCLIVSAGESPRGIREPEWSQELERHRFEDLGGVWLNDRVIRGEFEHDNDGEMLLRVYTEKGGEKPLIADQFILATGSFYSGGLVADHSHIFEPAFGLDVDYQGERHADWVNPDFFDDQPFMRFGVKVDEAGRACCDGRPVLNLQAVGSVVSRR
jgi:glycerol-3-phosphate dehydrogenase subunit B